MSHDDLNIAMLIKLLRMTESMHDGEALNAVRMANAMLAKHNANWDELMRGIVSVVDHDPFAEAPKMGPDGTMVKGYRDSTSGKHNGPEIDHYFDVLYARNLGSFKQWVDSVHEWWKEKGFLTDKQYDILKRSSTR